MSCTDFKPLIASTGFLLVISSQGIAAACSAVISALAARRCMNLHFHVNCRILIISLLLLYFAHSICVATLQAIQVMRYMVYADPCVAAIPSSLCFGLRFPAAICSTSIALLQVGLVVERAIALSKRHHYEMSGSVTGFTIIGSCVVVGTAISIWSLMQMNLHTEVAYCSVGTVDTAFRIKISSFILCGLDFFALMSTVLVIYFNELAFKRKYFDLQSSYQLQENIDVIRVVLPLTLFQTICHLMFTTSTAILTMFEGSLSFVTYRTLFAAVYIVPYYTMIAPMILLLLLKWSAQKRTTKLLILTKPVNELNVYFTAYSKMWLYNIAERQ